MALTLRNGAEVVSGVREDRSARPAAPLHASPGALTATATPGKVGWAWTNCASVSPSRGAIGARVGRAEAGAAEATDAVESSVAHESVRVLRERSLIGRSSRW